MFPALQVSGGEVLVVGGSITVFAVVAALSVRVGRRRIRRDVDDPGGSSTGSAANRS